jgi:hypothetical protein
MPLLGSQSSGAKGAPTAPTIGTVTLTNSTTVSIPFTPPESKLPITSYTTTSSPSIALSTSGTSSPLTVTGSFVTDVSYTFTVTATNANGTSATSSSSNSITPNPTPPVRGLLAGGHDGNATAIIEYITVTSTGNATSFGNLQSTRRGPAGCASATRGFFANGFPPGGYTTTTNVLDYVTIATTGNGTNFGNVTVGRGSLAGLSNSTRGVFGGGSIVDGDFNPASNVIDYVTMATTGNATSFGTLTQSKYYITGCASTTRGIFYGGQVTNSTSNIIEYITIASTGNGTNFGTLSRPRNFCAGGSSATRGVFSEGDTDSPPYNFESIAYITIASTGNATNFGNLSVGRQNLSGACSSSSRVVFAGGYASSSNSNVMDYVTVATTGNATYFGALTLARGYIAGCSNGHGGL